MQSLKNPLNELDNATQDGTGYPIRTPRISAMDVIFKELVAILNEIHGCSLSERFWRIYTEPYVSAVFAARERLSTEEVDPAAHTLDSVDLRNDSFRNRVRQNTLYLLKAIRSARAGGKVNKILGEYQNITFGFHGTAVETEGIAVEMKTYYPLVVGYGNKKVRQKVGQIAERQKSTYWKNVINLLPKIYVEHFDSLFKKVPLCRPKEKCLHVATFQSFYMRLLVAKYVVHGAKLFYYQHGGFYGEMRTHFAHWHESNISDEFRTWGWKLTPKDVPAKAYRLERFRKSYHSNTSEVQYDVLLCAPSFTNSKAGVNKEAGKHLLLELNRERYAKVLLRPRLRSKLANGKGYFKFLGESNFEIDTGKSEMAELVKKSMLVVQLSHPSTNFLECLSVDHPTVAILRNPHPTEIVKKYYRFFLEVGVLHEDAASLVNHLNIIDVTSWWQDVVISPKYQEFKNEFLRS